MEKMQKKSLPCFGVAHKEIDLKNPKTNRKNAGFTDEERGKFTELTEAGFIEFYNQSHRTMIRSKYFRINQRILQAFLQRLRYKEIIDAPGFPWLFKRAGSKKTGYFLRGFECSP